MLELEKLFESLCKPDPTIFRDENQATIRFIKNKFILTAHFAVVALQISLLPFAGSKSGVNIIRIAAGVAMLGIFVIFCRTRPLIGQIINASLLNALGYIITAYHPDGVYYGLSIMYVLPCGVFFLTQNLALTGVTSFLQTLIVKSLFKENLIEAINYEETETFTERLISCFVATAIPVQFLYLVVVYHLNQKTDELVKATKKAEEALEQQKIFLYSFSHEMRNPMNSLLGNLDLVLMGKVSGEIREMIVTAKVCGMLLLNLINTVLDAGKLGLGKLEIHPTSTKVHDVLQRVWSISHEIIDKKGLKSHLKISKTVPPKLMLDGHRLNQVLMNLIGNAIKFTENGSIMLAISWIETEEIVSDECFEPIPYDDENEGLFEKEYNLYTIKKRQDQNRSLILSGPVKEFGLEGVSQPADESRGVLKIIIKDTGCGMTKEDVGKLFQKFSQVGQVTTKRQMGTGLGLFISKEIVENMGGQIRAYSKQSVGSTFVICLPTIALPIQSPLYQPQSNLNDHLIPKLRARGFKAIVADDSSFNVSLVCNFYVKIGVEVLGTASNGQGAYHKYIEMMKSGIHIDVVTLDIDMPIMNGKEVCEKIRWYEKQNDMKRSFIVLISGNYEEKEMHNLLNKEHDKGADCFLKKPLVFEELCWALYNNYYCGGG